VQPVAQVDCDSQSLLVKVFFYQHLSHHFVPQLQIHFPPCAAEEQIIVMMKVLTKNYLHKK